MLQRMMLAMGGEEWVLGSVLVAAVEGNAPVLGSVDARAGVVSEEVEGDA